MTLEIHARYLTIEWRGPGEPRHVACAANPIEIERVEGEGWELELQIFQKDHAWLGVRFDGAPPDLRPIWLSPDGERRPLTAVSDAEGATWWIPALGWDGDSRRHFNAFSRSLGRFDVEIGGQRLAVLTVTHDSERVSLEDYLQDFQNELIWLALGFDGSANMGGGGGEGRADQRLASALADFSAALRRVAKRPAMDMREIVAEERIERLRPNAATFRHYARRPAAPRLLGRIAEEDPDIPDNRFLRHMTVVCMKLAQTLDQAAGRQAEFMRRMAELEGKRSEAYSRIEEQPVDPEVFDRQLADLEKILDQIRGYVGEESTEDAQKSGIFPIRLGGSYGANKTQFFYNRMDGEKKQDGRNYSVVGLPEDLAQLISAALHFSKEYSFHANVEWGNFQNAKEKTYFFLNLLQVSEVEIHTQAIENKKRKREYLERNGWRARLTAQEREEFRQAGRTAAKRGAKFQDMAEHAEQAGGVLGEVLSELRRIDQEMAGLGIGKSSETPTGMRYSLQPDYAACLSAYRRVEALSQRSGLGVETLERMESISALHASALYERWCLVKILGVLISDYGFRPEPNWHEQVVAAAAGRAQSFSIGLLRADIGFGAVLEVQPLLKNGRRPDFRLKFAYLPPHPDRPAMGGLAAADFKLVAKSPGLVMDAKFRARWKGPGDLEGVLEELISQKSYDSEGDRVFVLQPVANTTRRSSSPLEWGAHCDYGHDEKRNHRRGAIWVAPHVNGGDAQIHLRRLIALQLQDSFSQPIAADPSNVGRIMAEISKHVRVRNDKIFTGDIGQDWNFDELENKDIKIWISPSFCISCGKSHAYKDVIERISGKSGKRNGRLFWNIHCFDCKMITTRTHCYDCGGVLYKNRHVLTYHLTIADQITNVACPKCNAYFDKDLINL